MKTPEQWVDDERLAFDDDVIDCDRKEVEAVIKKAQDEAYAAGQEAQHRKTWALAAETYSKEVEADCIAYEADYTEGKRRADRIRALPCPPIEATKDK